jgi:hypothetical protein
MDSKTYPVTHSEEEWRRILTPEQYAVMRQHGTEAPGSCALLWEKRLGKFCFPRRPRLNSPDWRSDPRQSAN